MLGKIGISRGKSFEKLFSLEILMKIRRKMFFLRKKCTKDQLLVKLPIGSSEHLNAGV
jgi:hypothetical protein